GQLRRPPLRDLLLPRLRRTTIVATVLVACGYGLAFGAIQQLPQIVPGLSEVRAEAEGKPVPEQKKIEQQAAAHYVKVQEIGGLSGRLLLAVLAVRLISKRRLLAVFVVPSMIILPGMMWALSGDANPILLSLGGFDVRMLHVAIFL